MNLSESIGTDIAHIGDFLRAPNGDLQRISGLANLKQRLFRRLMTVPGTLIHRPDYGVGLLQYQNGLNSFSAQAKLAQDIEEQFAKDPAVNEVTGVSVNYDDANSQLVQIAVFVSAIGYSDSQQITFSDFTGLT